MSAGPMGFGWKKGVYGLGIGFICLMISAAYALDIDEKLTSRILRVSSSQHTILINRGLEDGLVIGDHAKFFLPEGVIARGVVVKASPSRSVWSLYRLVNPDLINSDTVVELKIATPVQLTSDPSKAFDRPGLSDVLTNSDQPASLSAVAGIPMGKGAAEGPGNARLSASDQEDLAALGLQATNAQTSLHKDLSPQKYALQSRNWELWVGGNLLTLAVANNGTLETFSYKGAPSFAVGGEGYFTQGSLRNLSLMALGNLYRAKKDVEYEGQKSTHDFTLAQFGLGANYHLWNDPHQSFQFLPFLTAQVGLGSAKDYMVLDADNSGEYSGSSFYAAAGAGVKYYVDSGAGARLVFDYYFARQQFNFDNDIEAVKQNAKGVHWMFSGSYRF